MIQLTTTSLARLFQQFEGNILNSNSLQGYFTQPPLAVSVSSFEFRFILFYQSGHKRIFILRTILS